MENKVYHISLVVGYAVTGESELCTKPISAKTFVKQFKTATKVR